MRNSVLTICLGLFVSVSVLANDIAEPSRGSSKWGENDERGAVNNITPDRVIGAAKLIKTGAVYQMGRSFFLAQREITLVGFDNWGADAMPGSDPELFHPAHQVLLTQNGIYILENLDTSALARDRVYEFAFFFAPLRLKGATGSPGNPVAIR